MKAADSAHLVINEHQIPDVKYVGRENEDQLQTGEDCQCPMQKTHAATMDVPTQTAFELSVQRRTRSRE